jgi:uncharacterized protein YegL
VPCARCTEQPTAQTGELERTAEDFVAMLEAEERAEDDVPTAQPISALPVEGPAAAGPTRLEIRCRLEHPSVPAASDPITHLLVDVTPGGAPFIDPKAGPVAHVILLLDVSASMNHHDKYPVLTEAIAGMLHELSAPGSAEVLLSVVVFAWGAKTLFRDVPASTLKPRDVLAMIDASPLRFGRYTDAAGALKRAGRIAVEQLKANKAMPTRVYLLTDGRPQDVVKTRAIMQVIAAMPVDVDALAFGNDADVALLQDLVSGGRGGTVKHVRSDTLGDAFDRIAAVAQRIVSNRAILEFDLAPGVVGSSAYRYRPGRHRFGDNVFGSDGRFRTDMGTLESGRTYSLLFELRLPETGAASTDIGRIRVRLRGEGAPRVFEEPVSVARTSADVMPEPDLEVVAARDVLAALAGSDPTTQIRALRVRRKLYVAERRDPHLIAVIDKAIAALEQQGNLAALSASEWATLRAHTCTAGSARPVVRRELATG